MYLKVKNSRGYAFFLAILPLIMMYRAPGTGMGLSTVLIAIGMIYAGLIILNQLRAINRVSILLPLMVYFIYVMYKSTGENILLCIAILFHLTAIIFGAVNVTTLKKIVVIISTISACLVILQLLVHTLTGVHIPFINYNLCISSVSSYRSAIISGISTVEGTYRPSALFLEPAHLTQYCIIGMVFCLFDEAPNMRNAIIISLGILCTTSGMGIVLVFVCWGWWFLCNNERISGQEKYLRLIVGCFSVVIVFEIFMRLDFFSNAVARITGTSSSGYNALHGRFFWWDTFFGDLSWKDLVYGYGLSEVPGVYFTGFMKQLYAYGIIGFVLLLVSLLVIMVNSNRIGKILLGVYIGLLFVANLTGFISMIFYIGIIVALYAEDKENNTCEIGEALQ